MAVNLVKIESKAKANEYGLTAKQVQTLALVVSGVSNKDIAEQLGISVWTVSNWTHSDKFKRALSAETEAILDGAKQRIAANADKAVSKLISTIETCAPSANVTKACQILLDKAGIGPADGVLPGGIDPQTQALVALIQQRRAAKELEEAHEQTDTA